MATTGVLLVRDVVTAALKKAGMTAWDEAPNSSDADVAIDGLNRLLKSWQNRGYNVWAKSSMTLTLAVDDRDYTLNPIRPLRILSARLVQSGVEMPMQAMTRAEYDDLPQKLSRGTPTCFHYSRQREDAVFYVWPVLAALGPTVAITYERETEDATDMSEQVDLPGEFYEAAVYGLAARLMDDSGRTSQSIVARAEEELRLALAFDIEDVVTFTEYYA